MRKFLLTLTAIVALTAASKAMVVYAEEMAMESEVVVVDPATTNEAVLNEVNGMGNEIVETGNEVVEAGSPETGSTY